MPKIVEDCVKAILDDRDFEPFEGKTREESAYAICWSRYSKEHKAEAVVELLTPDVSALLDEYKQNWQEIQRLEARLEEARGNQDELKAELLPVIKEADDQMIRIGDIVYRYTQRRRTTVSWKDAFKTALTKVNNQTRKILEDTVKQMQKVWEYEDITVEVARRNRVGGPLDWLRGIWNRLTSAWRNFVNLLRGAADELEALGEPPVPEEHAQASAHPLVRMDEEAVAAARELVAGYREHRERLAARGKPAQMAPTKSMLRSTKIKRTRYGA